MKFTIELDPKKSPNEVGELLREEFFIQDKEKGIFGCYSSFQVKPDVQQLADERLISEDDGNINFSDTYEITVHVYKKEIAGQKIIMKYYWEGDGTLEFMFEDGSSIINDDCKHDHGWYFEDQKNLSGFHYGNTLL